MTKFLFTIDVEEWYMAENVRSCLQAGQATNHSSLDAFVNLLQILDDRGIKATLFVVSELLKIPAYVGVLKNALAAGHEIASHSHSHNMYQSMSREETISDVERSAHEIDRVLGVRPIGFRSPCFSTNTYLAKVLLDAGFLYTSNGIQASFHDRYGASSPTRLLPDLPIPSIDRFGLSIPATGGGWFRLLPTWLQASALSSREVIVFYCHPWDFDVFQPKVAGMPLVKRFRHTVNVDRAIGKLNVLLDKHSEFMTCSEYLGLRCCE